MEVLDRLKNKKQILAAGEELAEKAVVFMVTPRTKQIINDMMSGLGYVLTETLSVPNSSRRTLGVPPMGLRFERELGEKPAYVEDIDLKGWTDPGMHQVVSMKPPENVINSLVVAGFKHKNRMIMSFFTMEI